MVTTRREAEARQDERIRSNSQIGSGDEKEKGAFLVFRGRGVFRLVTPFALAAAVIRVECRQRGPTPCALSIRSLRRAARVFDSQGRRLVRCYTCGSERGGRWLQSVPPPPPDQVSPYRRARSVGSHTNHRRSWRRGTPSRRPRTWPPRASSRRRQASASQRGVQRAQRGIENMDVTRPRRPPTVAALPLSSWLGSLRAARGKACEVA